MITGNGGSSNPTPPSDPCQGIRCGTHQYCSYGRCVCEEGYESAGTHCVCPAERGTTCGPTTYDDVTNCMAYRHLDCGEGEICAGNACQSCPNNFVPNDDKTACVCGITSCPTGQYKTDDCACRDCPDTKSTLTCPEEEGVDALGCPTYREKTCGDGEHLTKSCTCITCPEFDDSLTENACRTKQIDENGCLYWKEEENCLPCTETVEAESKDITNCASLINVVGCHVGGVSGAFCSYSARIRTSGPLNPTSPVTGETLWSRYPTLYQDVTAYNAATGENDCIVQVKGKMRSSDCPSGQVCIKGRCAESTQCSDNEMAINGLCIPYYDGCPANSRAAANGCYCKKGYQPTAWQSVTTRNGTLGSASETAITTCSPCPANSTATSDGVCACNTGYVGKYGEYKYNSGTNSISTKTYLQYCEACPHPIPVNSTVGSSCKNITCNEGYQPTQKSYYQSRSSSDYHYISSCEPCPPNSTGKKGGWCSCNTGYTAKYGEYTYYGGNGPRDWLTSRYLQSCQKK